jgi:hypothetical protein
LNDAGNDKGPPGKGAGLPAGWRDRRRAAGPVEFGPRREDLAAHPDGVRTFVASGHDWPTGTITDLVLELTQTTRLHSEYGPSTGWERRYPGW